MSADWIRPDAVFDGQALRRDLALELGDGRVLRTGPAPDAARRVAGTVVPGFVDLQVNGGGGVLLNGTPTPEGIARIAAAHRRFGTVAILPTVITDRVEVLEAAVAAVLASLDQPGILGLHIEGPHIAERRRGTHDGSLIRALDDRTLDAVARLRRAGASVMITLAPEAVGPERIAALAELGAVVSLGHTDAEAETVRAAIAAGARSATHVFNAMSQMTGRAPGAVGAILNSDIHAGIICDGHHVADEMVGLAIRARPLPDRMFLVSDAMATVGGPESFDLYGREIRLSDGRLVNAEGSLAGAHVTQAEGLRRLIEKVGIAPEIALRMVTSVPAACIGRPEVGGLSGRRLEDLLLLDADFAVTGPLSDHARPASGDAAA